GPAQTRSPVHTEGGPARFAHPAAHIHIRKCVAAEQPAAPRIDRSADLLAAVGATLHVVCAPRILHVAPLLAVRQLLAAAMARHAALPASFTRFLARPLVGCALRVCGHAALAGNRTLLDAVH